MGLRKSTEITMLEHVVILQRGKESISNYAKRNGISRQKMHYWVNKCKTGDITQTKKTEANLQFIDLGSFGIDINHNCGEDHSAISRLAKGDVLAEQPQPLERLPQITLSFPNGMCLKIY